MTLLQTVTYVNICGRMWIEFYPKITQKARLGVLCVLQTTGMPIRALPSLHLYVPASLPCHISNNNFIYYFCIELQTWEPLCRMPNINFVHEKLTCVSLFRHTLVLVALLTDVSSSYLVDLVVMPGKQGLCKVMVSLQVWLLGGTRSTLCWKHMQLPVIS